MVTTAPRRACKVDHMERLQAETALREHGWLAQEPPEVKDAVLARAQPINFGAGDVVFRIGDDAGGTYGIATGAIGILVATEGREPRLAHVARRGTWFGHGPLMTRGRRVLGFRAIEPTSTLYVSLAALSDLSRGSIAVARSLAVLANANMGVAIETVSDLLIPRVDRRVAATLLRATGVLRGMPPGDPPGYRLSQNDIAEMANASRQMVNRCLADFASRGWVRVGYQRIAILVPAALSAFASNLDEA
ncbi:Crp/Fnr family transcriptional regulator [Roseococcus sp. DSY-14]|uniref:Crp/Fnr family transcriptional regulator n=1 Tax=Roseococcus sp. DSY-14 TaxID=3369650 RepID=UPI00387AA35A